MRASPILETHRVNFNGIRAQLEMSDRDDGGFNSPEGKGTSDEGQRRKVSPSQLTVEGGAPEEKSGKGGPPELSDMNPAIEEEKKKRTI